MALSTHLLPHVIFSYLFLILFVSSSFSLSHHCRAPVSTTRKLGLDLDAPRQGLELLKGQGLGLFHGVADTVTGLFAKMKKQAVTPLIHAKITTATTATSSSSSSVQTPITTTSGGEGVVSADEGDDAGQKDVDAKMALTIGRDGTVTTNANTPHLRGGATAAAAAAVAVVAAAVAPLPTATTEPKTTTTSTTTTI